MPLLVLSLTHSAAAAGILSAVSMIPYLFGPLAGVLADRWDRKRVMALSDAGRVCAMGSIAAAIAAGDISVPLIAVAILVDRALATLYRSASGAALPRIVRREDLRAAAAMDRFAEEVSVLTGGPLGGLLYAAGQALPFLADAVSYALRMASLLFLRVPLQGEPAEERHLGYELVEGVVWFWRQPVIRSTSLALAAYNPVYVGSTLLLILLARRLGATAPEIGLLFALRAAGGLLGSALAPRIARAVELGPLLIATLFVGSAVFAALALVRSPILLGLLSGILVTIDAAALVAVVGYRLAVVPNALQGRVNSVFVTVETIGLPLGALGVGLLSQALGPRHASLLFAAWMLAVSVAALAAGSLRGARHDERNTAKPV